MPTVVDIPRNQRLTSVSPEYYAKGHCYAAEDVLRHQILVVAQRMKHVQTAIEDLCGEPCSLASLFESADLKLRKGRTGSFRVTRLHPRDLPEYLDEHAKGFGRVVIAATNPAKWSLQPIA